MKRTPLKRHTPFDSRSELARTGPPKRRAPVKRKRAKPRKGRERDPAYLEHVRSLPCLVAGCKAPSEAHHYGRRGVGQKCDDAQAAPLCGEHHRAWWHDKGHLPGMSPQESRELINSEGARLRAAYEEMSR